MQIEIIREKIGKEKLKKAAEDTFGSFVKAVVDVERKIMAIGGEMHADEEAVLLEDGSKQKNLWGINIYPTEPKENMIEFDSMINLRPSQGNKSRSVEDVSVQNKIVEVVISLIG